MELVQSRIVTGEVEGMSRFYAVLLGQDVVTNPYYVEVPTAGQSVALARMRFSDFQHQCCGPPRGVRQGEVILDFAAEEIDGEYPRIDALGVEWLMLPTMQPWGRRSMMFRDPEGHLVNVFSKKEGE